MSQNITALISKVLRNVQIEEDGSSAATQAQTDANSYIQERALDVWKRRLWREYIVLGSYSVPADTNRIPITSITVDTDIFAADSGRDSVLSEIVAVRNGNNPLSARDPGSINAINPDAWASTGNPNEYVNLGQGGIYLLGTFSEATTLNFMGKARFKTIAAGETWILDGEGVALIEGASGDMIRDHDRDDARANIRYQKYEAEIAKLIDAQEVQGSNIKQFVPADPWTGYFHDFSGSNYTSPTGGNWFV